MRSRRLITGWILGATLGAALAGASLAGCGGADVFTARRVATQDEAGSTHVAVTAVGFWNDYADALQPRFGLKESDAVQQAVPTTLAIESHDLTGVIAGIRAAMQSRAEAEVATDAGVPLMASAVPSAPSAPPAASPLGAPPATVITSQDLPTDALTRYHAATALFQEVRLLDNYVKLAVQRDDYVPYVVRVQVTLLPRARNMPYDAYADVAFFPSRSKLEHLAAQCRGKGLSDKAEPLHDQLRSVEDDAGALAADADECAAAIATKLKSILVVPLIVTDAAEAAASLRSAGEIRQLAGAISAMAQLFGASADATYFRDSLQTALGKDLNSLLTVARLTDNTVRVRLGAHQRGTSRFGMEPQNTSVTLLVLVPQMLALDHRRPGMRVVDVTARTTFVDAEDGHELPERTSAERDARLEAFGRALVAPGHPEVPLATWKALHEAVHDDDFQRYFVLYAGLGGAVSLSAAELWTDLAGLGLDERHATLSFQLPSPFAARPCLYDGQIALLDEGAAGAAVDVVGRSLAGHRVRAALRLAGDKGAAPIEVRPSKVEAVPSAVKDGDDRITLTFPKLTSFHLPTADARLAVTVVDELHGWESDEARRKDGCRTTVDLATRYRAKDAPVADAPPAGPSRAPVKPETRPPASALMPKKPH